VIAGTRVLPEAGGSPTARLGQLSFTRANADPLNAELRRSYLAALARHQEIKLELVPLIAAWRAAGIEVLLFKGFFLSEFVYPVPGARFHGDVDLLMHPEHGPAALRIAEGLGWRRRWLPRRFGAADGSELLYLYGPSGAALLDVHQLLAPAGHWWTWRQRRITDAVWAASELREWEGTAVRVPSPIDAIVVNLALERAAMDRARGFKPHDPVDLYHLLAQTSVSEAALRRRARELGVPRTLAGLLRLCPPSSDPVATGRLPARKRLPWMLAGWWESGFLHVPMALLRPLRAPGLAWDVVRTAPLLIRVRRALRRHKDVRDVLGSLTPAPCTGVRSSALTRWRTVRAIHWATRLFPSGSAGGRCLLQSLAIYAAFRRQRWDVTFVSGVGRDAAGLRGHAWVEEDGRLLPELVGREPVSEYQPNFRYPPPA
jgi:hypothetical protein